MESNKGGWFFFVLLWNGFEDQRVLRRSDAWSEESIDTQSVSSLSGCVDQSLDFHRYSKNSLLADSVDKSDAASLHWVYWDDRLVDPTDLLRSYAY